MTKEELIENWRERASNERRDAGSWHASSIAARIRLANANMLELCSIELEAVLKETT